ncbi:ABC transporter [Streptomyces sp. NPDC003635]
MRGVIRYVGRTVPWRALGAGAAAGLALTGSARLFPEAFTPWLTLNALRAAALAFALGLAFLLDDPARHTTATVPVRRPVRQALRLAWVVPFAGLFWTSAVLLVPSELRPPVGAVTLEAGAAWLLAPAVSAAWIRRSEEPEPGVGVGAGLLTAGVLAALFVPDLFVGVGDPGWADAHQWWALVVAGAVAGWTWWSREPVRTWGRGEPHGRPPRTSGRGTTSPCGTSGPSRRY